MKPKKELTPEQKEKRIFIIRAIVWGILACGLPVAFIAWRYDLFRKAGDVQLSGLGIIGIIIIIAFVYVLAKYIKAGMFEWSMTKQIISGVIKVLLPLGGLLGLLMGIRSSLDYFIQALSCVILCEAMAIPVNPFPKWVYEKTKGRFESMVDMFADKLNGKKDKEE